MYHSQPKYSKNTNLTQHNTKIRILKYLHSSGINLNTKHEHISGETELNAIRDGDYLICPRYSGTRSWIIFFKCDVTDVYYAINFPKRNYPKKDQIVIYPIEISVKPTLYNGTIMEGIYFKMDDKRYLVIDEVYKYAGEDFYLKPKEDRLDFLTKQFKSDVTITAKFNLLVSQYYMINRDSLKELNDNIKSNPSIQEIIFYPKLYGKKIYSYTIINADLVDNVIRLCQLYLEKTGSPDVYNIYYANSDKKIDIAYIPDIQTSKKCKQWFKDAKNQNFLLNVEWIWVQKNGYL